MSSSDSEEKKAGATNNYIVKRLLSSPYFTFRTPNAVNDYFSSENYPVIMDDELLSRFLPPAYLNKEVKPRQLEYDYTGIPVETLRPLDFLPQSEVDAFINAAKKFYEKAYPETQNIVAHEKDLRKHFKLPDPDKEPDAYWVYGADHEMKLLILWGVEHQKNSSLSLVEEDKLNILPGNTIADKLRNRTMTWEVRQREMLKILFSSNEPLRRFMVRPVYNESGDKLVALQHDNEQIPINKLKTLSSIGKSELNTFRKAAHDFYSKAYPDYKTSTDYEKELRRGFMLPDPDKPTHNPKLIPSYYWTKGNGKIYILATGKEDRASCLYLTKEDKLQIPPKVDEKKQVNAEADLLEFKQKEKDDTQPQTVYDKLQKRVSTWQKYALIGGVPVIGILAFLIFHLIVDQTPPKIIKENLEVVSDHELILEFDEPVDINSIQHDTSTEVIDSIRFENDEVSVKEVKYDSGNNSRLLILTTPMIDGEHYTLTVRKLTDQSENKNLIEPTSIRFQYMDRVAPEVKSISAGKRGLDFITVFFNESLDSESVYKAIFELYSKSASPENKIKIISSVFDETDSEKRTVIIQAGQPFKHDEMYSLRMERITDLSISRNPIISNENNPYIFTYIDRLPPLVSGVKANADELKINVEFDEKIEKSSAVQKQNYTVKTPDGTVIQLQDKAIFLGDDGKSVVIGIQPVRLYKDNYTLLIENVKDASGISINQKEPFVFKFISNNNDLLPRIIDLNKNDSKLNQIELVFNKIFNQAKITDPFNYSISNARADIIDKILPDKDNYNKVIVKLKEPLDRAGKYKIAVENIDDLFGNRVKSMSKSFTIKGMSDIISQELDYTEKPKTVGNKIIFQFNSKITDATATNISNYKITGNAKIDEIQDIGDEFTKISIKLNKPIETNKHTITINNLIIVDLSYLGKQNLPETMIK